MKKERISDNVIARLPKYYRCVDDLYHSNCIRISSATLSNLLGFTAAQVRQDFSHFGEFGQQGYGYNVRKLRLEIREILGLNNHHACILLGCGNLGHALLRNFNFEACGFFMLEAFDTNPEFIGTTVNGIRISDARSLDDMIACDCPQMAVLTVPQDIAQSVAEHLCEQGISAIWNFTGQKIEPPNENVVVEQVNFADSLLKLSYRLSQLELDTWDNENDFEEM